jgi:hypothetical protein
MECLRRALSNEKGSIFITKYFELLSLVGGARLNLT